MITVRCSATTNSGNPCQNAPMRGLDVCGPHITHKQQGHLKTRYDPTIILTPTERKQIWERKNHDTLYTTRHQPNPTNK